MASEKQKEHISMCVCGHVDAGKSTTTGHLIFDLGGINEREMAKLRQEAEILGKSSFAFAFLISVILVEMDNEAFRIIMLFIPTN